MPKPSRLPSTSSASEERCSGFRTDVSELDEFEALREDVEQRLGPVDILANNAGSLTTPSHCGHRRPRWWSVASRST
ncbi:SDR family NAD(P)-dependent oxidoreductase [Streptomyces malaysiensis]|uniref:SDR family NAD(P)-dependent oxidoreductase n=1 Tax=Streptomyces malaysiensis TaxID=92644 RepID=UPI00384C6D11